MKIDKSSLRYDILKEMFNISFGRAASMLSEITNRRILLDVPDIEIFDIETENLNLDRFIPETLKGTLMVSSISFEEKLVGKANLIFKAQKMRKFINLCLHKEDIGEHCETKFTDVDFDIIKEVGNIILNSMVGEIANNLSISLNYTLPEVNLFDRDDFNKHICSNQFKYILVLYITFLIDDTEVKGAVVVDLTLASLKEVMKKIDMVKDELYE